MPLGNPRFIELDPRIVAEDRQRFREAQLNNLQPAVGKIAVTPEALFANAINGEQDLPADTTEPASDKVSYFQAPLALRTNHAKPDLHMVF